MQTRHFDRISTPNATLFRLTGETVLLGVLACFSSAFLAVRRLQTDGQSGLVQNIGHATLLIGLVQSAEIRILLGEYRQSGSQSDIVGLDVCCVLALVEQDDCFFFVFLVYIRDLLGHSGISTTEIYAWADKKMKRTALIEAYDSPSSDELPTWKKVLFYKILIGCYRLSAYTCARIPITSFFIYFSSLDLFIL